MTSLRPFNTSTKDTQSLKLRNAQLSSKESERLDTDNLKMEQRLRELKQSMGRQKQERDKMQSSNGAIWSSGKPGAVTNHASDLLRREPSKPSNSKGKPRKIRVLKDTPIDIPKRPSFAASLVNKSPPKLKGPACGQCEQKVVALTCMECGENYCTTCFAKFHLKGALKNHRSLPYQSTTSTSNASSLDLSNRMTPSPKSSSESLPPRPSSANRRTTTSTDTSSEDQVKTIPVTLKDPGERTGGVFLEGNFSEEESALSFAQALAEWRAGKQADSSVTAQTQELKKVESIASGTSTEPVPTEQVEIQFKKDTSITYADKLLLKKHRRTELSPMSSPRDEKEGRSPGQQGTLLPNGDIDPLSDDENELQEEHERYVGIFAKSKSSDEPRLESALSIVDVTETPSMEVVESESAYSVQEVDEPNVDHFARGDSTFTPSNPNSSQPPPGPLHLEPSPKTKSDKLSTAPPSASSARDLSSGQKQRCAKSSSKPSRTVSTPLRSTSDKPANKQQRATPKLNAPARLSSARPAQSAKPTAEKIQAKHKSKSASVASNRRSLSRSLESANQPESKTLTAEDVSGRVSTLEDGRVSAAGLTSTPSGELLTASHLTRQTQHHYKAGLGDFFLAGLGGEEGDLTRDDDAQLGVTTPTNKLPACSYKGTMLAWRPDSSLATPTPSLRESLQPFSPSPPAKSGRQSHRSAAKTRSVKLSNAREPQSAKAREGSSKVTSGPDVDNTISWMLSEHLPRKGDLNGNNNGEGDEGLQDGRSRYRQIGEPDRSSSRIEVDGDDMSMYDDIGKDYMEMEDRETLEKLTWELASASGRVTADGRLTSMSLPESNEDIYRENSYSQDAELGIMDDAGMGSGLSTPFDFLTGESLSREMSDEEEDVDETELQKFTAEVQALT